MTRAAVYDGPGTVTVRDLPAVAPGPDEVLVEVAWCGICGSDLHLMLDGWGTPGGVAGHEWSGRVIAVGAAVDDVRVGDEVVGGPASCGTCEWCRARRPALCVQDPLRTGWTGHGGAFAEQIVVPSAATCPVPAGLSLRTAALAEPLAVALHGLSAGRVDRDSRVLVSGAGPLGLLAVAALVDRGVARVDVVEPVVGRRERALALGAGAALAPESLPVPDSVLACVPDGYDVVLETSGRAPAIGAGLGVLRPAGRLVIMGTGSAQVRVEPVRLLVHELTVTGAYCYDDGGVPDALDLLATGRLPVSLLTAADVPLTGLVPAMRQLAAGDIPAKVLVRPGEGHD